MTFLGKSSDVPMDVALLARLIFGLAVQIIMRYLEANRITLTEARIDIAVICMSLMNASFCFLTPGTEAQQRLNLTIRLVPRCAFSVLYMKSHISTWLNLLNALGACWCHLQEDEFGARKNQMLVCSELVAWLCTTLLCIITESVFLESVKSERAAVSAKHAVERLLSCLCDSVVRLGQDLRISRATPQLAHLLSPTVPFDPQVLEGSLLSNLLATEADREKFASFISDTPSFPAPGGHSA